MPLPMLTVGGSPSHRPQGPSQQAQGWREVCCEVVHARDWGRVANGWWQSCWPAWRAVGWGWGRGRWWGASYAWPYCPEEPTPAASDSRWVLVVCNMTSRVRVRDRSEPYLLLCVMSWERDNHCRASGARGFATGTSRTRSEKKQSDTRPHE